MPTYALVDTKTGDEWEEFFISYSELCAYLEENPTVVQGVNSINIVAGVGSQFKTDKEFQSLLKHVKKNNKGAKIEIN